MIQNALPNRSQNVAETNMGNNQNSLENIITCEVLKTQIPCARVGAVYIYSNKYKQVIKSMLKIIPKPYEKQLKSIQEMLRTNTGKYNKIIQHFFKFVIPFWSHLH